MAKQNSKNVSKVFFPSDDVDKHTCESFVVPAGVEWIGNFAFDRFRSLKRVVLPEGVTHIRSNSFSYCISLKDINIPQSVYIIESDAFSSCALLDNIVLPKHLIELGEGAFKSCVALSSINIPESLRSIENQTFRYCSALEKVELPKRLKYIGDYAFANCTKLKDIVIPQKIKEISASTFNGCEGLTYVELPKHLFSIGQSAFNKCTNLKELILPLTVREIDMRAFASCKNFKSFEIPKGVKELKEETFYECERLENVVLPQDIKTIGKNCFSHCYGLSDIDLPESVLVLGPGAFSYCQSLKSFIMPPKVLVLNYETFYKCKGLQNIDLKNVEFIGNNAFDGCESLEKVALPSCLKEIGENVFNNCRFEYVYKLKGQDNIIFSKTKPVEECERLIDLSKVRNAIVDFDIGLFALESNIDKYMPLIDKISKSKMSLPVSFLKAYERDSKLDALINEKDYRFLKAELPDIFARINLLNGEYEKLAFFKFADALGCFSKEKYRDKYGRETETPLAQKASRVFATLLKSDLLINENFDSLVGNLPVNIKPNQDFLNFIASVGENKKLQNLELLLEFDDNQPGVFERIVKRFDIVKKYRTAIDENGKPCNVPWREAIKKFLKSNQYENITNENKDIALIFSEHGLSQDVFDEASKLRDIALKKKIKSHILSSHLKEESIIEKIERIKNSTGEMLGDSKKIIDELYAQKFTYEMLDKHDPKNAIIGLYCSCCATLTSTFYGRHIVNASMTENDVQNLIVRDAKGDIIAKAAMYVNSVTGYAVINEFELNEKYKANEYSSGKYTTSDSNQENDRELIFAAFKRGINAFVSEYDKEHPKKPILQVAVGMGYNRLKKQCERYKDVTLALQVPVDYFFQDAAFEQKVLYERGIPEKKLLVKNEKQDNNQK